MALDDVIQQSTQQLLPQGFVLPPFLNGAYKAFHWAHKNCHWIRRGRVYPKYIPALIGGGVINFAFGDNRCLRFVAQLALISNRIIECVEAQMAFSKEHSKWKDALWNNYPLATVHKWQAEPIVSYISPSTSHRLYVRCFHSEHYLQYLCYRTAMLAKKLFFLSTATIDAIDACSLNVDSSQAVNELVLNGFRSLDIISENREGLRNTLVKNKTVITCVLKNVKAPYQADQFIGYIDKMLATAETGNGILQKANGVVGSALKESAKYFGFGVMSAVGLASAAPDCLVPAKSFSKDSSSDQERFAPIYPRDYIKEFWAKPQAPKKNSGMSLQDAYAAACKNSSTKAQLKSRNSPHE